MRKLLKWQLSNVRKTFSIVFRWNRIFNPTGGTRVFNLKISTSISRILLNGAKSACIFISRCFIARIAIDFIQSQREKYYKIIEAIDHRFLWVIG